LGRFKFAERTNAELLTLCFSNEVDFRDKEMGIKPPKGWAIPQTAGRLNEPPTILEPVAAEWDERFAKFDLLFEEWPSLSRAGRQIRLAAIAPITGLMFDGGIDPCTETTLRPLPSCRAASRATTT